MPRCKIYDSRHGRRSCARAAGLRKLALAGLLALIAASPVFATEFYVSPSAGGSGTGSFSNPWTLAAALAGPVAVRPGDTIWLRGGRYSGSFTSSLTGATAAPIVVRQYAGERATIDGNLVLNGSDTWFWGFEVLNSNPVAPETIAIDNKCPRSKLINLFIHDSSGNGIGTWEESPDSEVSGSIFQYCGVVGNSGVPAHGIYTQNRTGSKLLKDNILIDTYGYGVHVYGQSGSLNNITVDGNTVVRSGQGDLLVTGGISQIAPVIRNNMTYRSDGNVSGRFDSGGNATTLTVVGNTLVGGAQVWSYLNVVFTDNVACERGEIIQIICPSGVSPAAYSWDRNTYKQRLGSTSAPFAINMGGSWDGEGFAGWRALYGRDVSSTNLGTGTPTGTKIVVRPNAYEAGRANVTIYNWSRQATIGVDLTGILTLGTGFEVRNAQDFYGAPVTVGTYSGALVTVPMNGLSVAPPVGGVAPASTAPDFGAFVVLPVAVVGTPTPMPTSTPTRTPTATPPPPTPTPTSTPTPPPSTPTPTPTAPTATPTRTPTLPPPTPTPTPTPTLPGPTATPTRTPTLPPPTPTPTLTPTLSGPTATPTPTPTGPPPTQTPTLPPPTSTPAPTRTSTPTQASAGMSLFTISPCRVIDTRWANGPLGGPELAAGIDRAFVVVNQCSIPPTARAIAFNVAVTAAETPGFLVLYAAGTARPPTSILNYRAHQTRAKSGITGLGASGGLAAFAGQSSGTVNLILDVTGYFQ